MPIIIPRLAFSFVEKKKINYLQKSPQFSTKIVTKDSKISPAVFSELDFQKVILHFICTMPILYKFPTAFKRPQEYATCKKKKKAERCLKKKKKTQMPSDPCKAYMPGNKRLARGVGCKSVTWIFAPPINHSSKSCLFSHRNQTHTKALNFFHCFISTLSSLLW